MLDLREAKEFIKDMAGLVFTVVAVLFVIVYVASVQQVVGRSMEPTLKEGDILLLNKLGYRFFDIKRFDIVAVNSPTSKYMVKRVVGLPGEKIEYVDNVLYIDGKGYKEKFLDETVITENFSITELGYETIPEDMYLVLGDNRTNSQDSRDAKIGLVKKDDILGKNSIRIWPLNEIGIIK